LGDARARAFSKKRKADAIEGHYTPEAQMGKTAPGKEWRMGKKKWS
jgi:hypothetical protein